jgi:hypothetical protein
MLRLLTSAYMPWTAAERVLPTQQQRRGNRIHNPGKLPRRLQNWSKSREKAGQLVARLLGSAE